MIQSRDTKPVIISNPMKFSKKEMSINVDVLNFIAPNNVIPNSSGKGEAIINEAIPGISHLNLLFFID